MGENPVLTPFAPWQPDHILDAIQITELSLLLHLSRKNMTRKSRVSLDRRTSVPLVSETVSYANATVRSTDEDSEPEPSTGGASIQLVAPAPEASDEGDETRRFGSYELVWELCRDALSTTWAARRDGMDGIFALRIFNARLTDSVQVRSIKKAAQCTSELTHINHVTVYECGVGDNGAPYVVKDWVEGETLAETFLVNKRLDIATFLNVFMQVCEALNEAHSHQLVHGNLSPNKVIVVHQDDTDAALIKLIDFGMPPDPVQNAFYLSPEQCLDRNRVGERSDIYSLGCIMYESLIGRPPFVGDPTSHASAGYLHELASQHGKDTPEYNALKLLDCIIIKCLQKKPAKRFRNVRELMDALRMVSDCICNGVTRKLPPKAEKLLLFRFLDFFDKKIVACLCAYLLLGLVCQKYLGELQLQKSIDDAQLAGRHHFPEATTAWRLALSQAEALHKPPSLQAELNWELADTLRDQIAEPGSKKARNAVAEEALKHYEAASHYYSHGTRYRSYEMMLLNQMSGLWLQLENPEKLSDTQDAAREKVRTLYEQKKYKQCAQSAASFLKDFDDLGISYYAGCANTEMSKQLPPEKALPYLELAEFHYGNSGQLNPANDDLEQCLVQLGYMPAASKTYPWLACRALENGNMEAARMYFGRGASSIASNALTNAFADLELHYRDEFRQRTTQTSSKKAIVLLERLLQTQEQAWGKNDRLLAETLSDLARCYRENGQDQKAIETYKRLFDLVPGDEWVYRNGFLAFVDLLDKYGQRAEARKQLEKRLRRTGGSYSIDEQLVRLLQLYAADKQGAKIRQVLDVVCPVPEPERFIKYIPTGDYSYSRDFVPYPRAQGEGDVFANGQ